MGMTSGPTERTWPRRRFLVHGMITGGLVSAPWSLLAGCDALGLGDTLERVRSEGVIRVGHAGERPYAYQDDGVRGAVPAVSRAVFRRIDLTLELHGVQTLFRELIDGLNAGRFDMIVAGMFVRGDRCDRVAFSEPLYCARPALLVKRGNPLGLADYASVRHHDARLAVLGGAVEHDDARAAGVPHERIVLVGRPEDGLRAVATGVVDAFALTRVSLRSLHTETARSQQRPIPEAGEPRAARLAERVEVLSPFAPGARHLGCGAVAFRKTDRSLRDAFNAGLAALIREGELLDLLEPYGLGVAELPSSVPSTAELCRRGGAADREIGPLPR